jgi:hypothetical protein
MFCLLYDTEPRGPLIIIIIMYQLELTWEYHEVIPTTLWAIEEIGHRVYN